MAKQTKRKGFTLVEMLVVIAIIAVLVSIIIPMIGRSTTKAAAATNAANLRSIEGKISTMRVENPQIFQSVIEKAPSTLLSLFNDPTLTDRAKMSLAVSMGLGSPDEFGDGAIIDLEGWINSGTAATNYAKYKVFHDTADENHVITISVSPSVMVPDVPESEEVSAGDMQIPAGTPMTVYISDIAVVATYEYGGNSYTRNDFATVVETGDFEGSGSGGLTGEDAGGILDCENGSHTLVKCVCKYCGESFHNYVSVSEEEHKCTGDCGNQTGHSFNLGYCNICGYSKVLNDFYCKEGCGSIAIFDGYCSSHRYAVTCGTCGYVFRASSQNSTACPKASDPTAHPTAKPCSKCTGYARKSIINSNCRSCGHAESSHAVTGSYPSYLGGGPKYDGGKCNVYE